LAGGEDVDDLRLRPVGDEIAEARPAAGAACNSTTGGNLLAMALAIGRASTSGSFFGPLRDRPVMIA
jgi:hypothetical protein